MSTAVNRWRGPLIAACAVAAAAHVPVTDDHLREAPYIGVLFIALEVVALALAVLLLRRDDRRLYLAAGLVGLMAVTAYVASRSLALPQIGDDVGNWTEPLGIVSLAAELVMMASGWAGAGLRARFAGVRRRRAVASSLALLSVGLAATGVAAGDEPAMVGMHASYQLVR